MSRWQFWVTTLIAACCVVLMAAGVLLGRENQAARAEIGQRQQFVQQSVQLEGLYREIVRALAELAARNNDSDVKAMLQRHGITFNVAPPAKAGEGAAGSEPATAGGSAKGRK